MLIDGPLMIRALSRLFAKRRLQKLRLAQRKIDSDRARKGHSTRIHNQFLRDPIIREMRTGTPASHQSSQQ